MFEAWEANRVPPRAFLTQSQRWRGAGSRPLPFPHFRQRQPLRAPWHQRLFSVGEGEPSPQPRGGGRGPGEAAGGGSWGERSREPGLTARAGGQDGRTGGREAGGRGTAVQCGSKRGRAASGGWGDERPRAGDAAGAGSPASPGVGPRGSRAEQELGPRGEGRGRQAPGKALRRAELLARLAPSRSPGPAR